MHVFFYLKHFKVTKLILTAVCKNFNPPKNIIIIKCISIYLALFESKQKLSESSILLLCIAQTGAGE